MILPHHRLLDGAREKAAGDAKIGTTLARHRPGLRVRGRTPGNPGRRSVPARCPSSPRGEPRHGNGRPPERPRRRRSTGHRRDPRGARVRGEKLRPHVTDTGRFLRDHLRSGGTLLGEGAHGAMLDLCAGTYPFVTSSHCTAASMASGLQIPPSALDASLVVLKAYTTRVGSGPFPTELEDETGEFLRSRGNEYGTSTGRPRRTGWFDAIVGRLGRGALRGAGHRPDQARRASTICRQIQVCVGYRLGGRTLQDFPPLVEDVAILEPVYEQLPGLAGQDDGRHPLRGAAAECEEVRSVHRRTGRRNRRVDLDGTPAGRDDLARRLSVSFRPSEAGGRMKRAGAALLLGLVVVAGHRKLQLANAGARGCPAARDVGPRDRAHDRDRHDPRALHDADPCPEPGTDGGTRERAHAALPPHAAIRLDPRLRDDAGDRNRTPTPPDSLARHTGRERVQVARSRRPR